MGGRDLAPHERDDLIVWCLNYPAEAADTILRMRKELDNLWIDPRRKVSSQP